MDRIWLVGNRGMLGSAVERVLKSADTHYVASDREVDITDYDAVQRFVEGRGFGWIINCAAYTAVDRAEDEPGAASRLNALGPKNLARAARSAGAGIVHVSTDYVFDGRKAQGYREDDRPSPISVYGRSKWAGEEAVRHSGAAHYIVRTAWLFGERGKNFVSTMLTLFAEGKKVRVVEDQWGSPTYAGDLAEALVRITRLDPPPDEGVYHFTNDGAVSWYGFACEIFSQARRLGLCGNESEIEPVPSSAYLTRARRPVYSFLHTDKIRDRVMPEIRSYQSALNSYLETFRA